MNNQTLTLSVIRADGGTQPRATLNMLVVDEYAEAMKSGATFPPVTVFYDGSEYWLADGFHRLNAAKSAGLAQIAADVRQGTRRDAVLYSVGANGSHGLRRTNEDKRRAVETLLSDAEWRAWGSGKIAGICNVTERFVRKMFEETGVSRNRSEIQVERNGSTYTMNTRNIGTRPTPQPQLAMPAPIREVIRHTPLADNPAELRKFEALTPAKQQEIARIVATGKADTVQAGLRIVKEAVKQTRVEERDRAAAASSHNGSGAAATITTQSPKAGEFWKLGRHTLYCGDTSERAFIERAPVAAFAFADPPYNAGVADWDSGFKWGHDWLIERVGVVAVTPGIVSIFEFARVTQMPYLWSVACWIDNGMTRGAMGFGNWLYAALFSRSTLHRGIQDHFRVSIKASETGETEHKGRKPAEFVAWLMQHYSQTGEVVVDPFLGSGTTLLVAESMGRACYGGELNPAYCAAIIARWEHVTGRQAEREE